MARLLSLLSLVVLSVSNLAAAGSSCVAFDVSWNLLAFGFNGKDYNAGTQDTWSSGNATDITTSGRPPFDGPNTTCYLSQFTNAIYFLGADSTKPNAIHIYDAAAKAWSTQDVNTVSGFDQTSSFATILDHDTNVFYAYSHGELFSLDMKLLKTADPSPVTWVDVQKLAFNTDNYQPVMALAQNHVHFLGIPGAAAGTATIFVIHFSFLQPDAQSYGNFPETHGQATSFFKDQGVQEEFAYIPDDGSATYVINVETNTTQTLKGPATKDAQATYFASTTALVQLSSSGTVSFLPYDPSSASANSAASWSVVSKLPVALASSSAGGGSNSSSSTTPSGTGSAAKPGQTTSTSSGSSSSGNSTSTSGAISNQSISVLMTSILIIAASLSVSL